MMPDIDPQYIDVEFPGDLGGDVLPEEQSRFGAVFGNFAESSVPQFPRSQWDELSNQAIGNEIYVQKIKDQGSEPSCVSNAFLQNLEMSIVNAFGQEFWVELAPISLYWFVGNKRSGSTLSDNAYQLSNVGCLPVDSAQNRELFDRLGLDPIYHSANGYDSFGRLWNSRMAECQRTMSWFRQGETWRFSGFDQHASLTFVGFGTVYARSGHSICGNWAEKDGNRWLMRYANSWSPNWGSDGYGWDSERGAGGSGYAIRGLADGEFKTAVLNAIAEG